MNRLDFLKPYFKQLQDFLTRDKVEKMILGLVVLCASSILWFRIPSQKTLTFDGKKLVYQGYVVRNKMSGQGELTFENGDHYKGNFENGVFEGKGTFTAKDGWTYEGDFQNGLAHGQGQLTTKEHTIYKGTFKQGIYQHEN